jgi:alkanesulfonate monooxygenase SsuD/methylene tetrahydromethanopterin reductase-like flavin-dependent oxidoreductase (luciferase family)
MQVGITLPTFREDAAALEVARRAEALGLDGVFAFDHLWPPGRPDLPSLSAFPVLGAVAAVTERICLGPLVARVGLVPDEVLVAELRSLSLMAPGRLIAGLGTGDQKSASENLSYGISASGPEERRQALRLSARSLIDFGVPVWVGGSSVAITELAVELGSGASLNLWEARPSALAAVSARCETTWGGSLGGGVAQVAQSLHELADAGATWAVCAWPRSLEDLSEAVEVLRRDRDG